MPTPVNHSDGSLLTTIPDNSSDTSSTSLVLFGLGADPFVEALNENVVRLLENSAGASEPANPLVGQFWCDTSGTAPVVKFWDGSEWSTGFGGGAGSSGDTGASSSSGSGSASSLTGDAAEAMAEVQDALAEVQSTTDYLTGQASDANAAAAQIIADLLANATDDDVIQQLTYLMAGTVDGNTALQAESIVRSAADQDAALQVLMLGSQLDGFAATLNTYSLTSANSTSALASQITALETGLGSANSAITAEVTARTTGDQTLASQYTSLNSDYGTFKANTTNQLITLANATTSAATSISSLQANSATTSAAIMTEQTVRANAVTALTGSITVLTANIAGANAAITSEATTRANADTALSGSISIVQANLDTANATITTESTARTTADSALGSRIDTVSAGLLGANAAISTAQTTAVTANTAVSSLTTTVSAKTSGNSSQCPYGNFEEGFSHWSGWGTGASVYADPNYGHLAYFGAFTANAAIISDAFPLAPNQTYTLSGNIQCGASPAVCYLDILGYDSTAALVYDGPQNALNYVLNTGYSGPNYTCTFTTPSNVVQARVRYVINPYSGGAAVPAWAQHIKLEQGPYATPYTAEATVAIQSATLVDAYNRTRAYAFIAATAGAGTALLQLNADDYGTNVQLVANKVYFGPNMTVDETTQTYTWDYGGYKKVIGVAFGSSGQFVEWFGPSMALSAMTEGNAISYLKNDGSAYFGGSLSAGTLTTKAATSDTSASAVAETSVFGSLGHTITVTLSYTYSATWDRTYPGNSTGYSAYTSANSAYSSGAQSGTPQADPGAATIALYRSLNGAAYVQVATLTATGSWTITSDFAPNTGDNEAGAIIIVDSNSGAITYTDPDNVAENRQYKAVMTARNPYSTVGVVQNVSVICVEA